MPVMPALFPEPDRYENTFLASDISSLAASFSTPADVAWLIDADAFYFQASLMLCHTVALKRHLAAQLLQLSGCINVYHTLSELRKVF